MSIKISQLLGILNNARGKYQINDPALYQVINSLINNLQDLLNTKGQSDLVQALTDLQKIIQALELLSFITSEDDSATLKNSRQLIAGTNITLDDSVINKLTINASGGSGSSNTSSAVYIPRENQPQDLLIIPPSSQLLRSMGFVITGGSSSPITGGQDFYPRAPTGGVFTHWSIVGGSSGSVTTGSAVVDIKKSTNFGTPSFSSICASDKPTLSSAKTNDGNCVGWTTSFNQGDVFQPNLDSVSVLTSIIVTLWYLPR